MLAHQTAACSEACNADLVEATTDSRRCLRAGGTDLVHDSGSKKPARLRPSRKCSWSRGTLIRI